MARLDEKSEPAVRVTGLWWPSGASGSGSRPRSRNFLARWAQLLILPGSHLARPINAWAREHDVNCMECARVGAARQLSALSENNPASANEWRADSVCRQTSRLGIITDPEIRERLKELANELDADA